MHTAFTPVDLDFERRVRASFARQAAMRLIGATMTAVEPGRCTIELPVRHDLTQQHGFVHGGIVGMIADSAGGYAAFTLMPADASVLTVEYKINMLAPARGERLVAVGSVVKPGRTLSIVRADVHAIDGARETLVAAMQQTLMVMHGVSDEPHI
ncbi:MAG: PaaI family thioesterase [Burkholderiaceae bacterium]